jgi:CheY-like chemotaxis protein
LRRIFDPFFTTKLSAHGLGLAAVRGIVHQHRGLLRIDSAPDRGSTFTVLIPASHRTARSHRPPATATSWTATGEVLLVDDNPHVLEVGRRMLEIIGFSVASYESGAAAVAAFAEDPLRFCLAVVDLTMPEMDGSEVAMRLRDLRAELPILLSSGYSEMEVVSQSETEQGVAYLPKPYTLQELRMRVQAIVGAGDTDEDDWLD